jgi:hypothetical protein
MLQSSLSERREEFDNHFALAQALQDRLFAGEVSIGEAELSSRHILTIKSGLLVHLYNIVEATMTSVGDLIGDAVGATAPKEWTDNALREWLREAVVSRDEGGEENRLKTIHSASKLLLEDRPLGAQKVKKPPGSWSDKVIAKFAQRLGVEFKLPDTMWRRIASRAEFRDASPLEFLADRRNAIAHGRRSFESGANDLTLDAIRELADVTLDYLILAIDAFEKYVGDNQHLVNAS